MAPYQFRHLEEIFHGALQLAEGPDRDRFLRASCDSNPAMFEMAKRLVCADSLQWETNGAGDPTGLPSAPLPRFGVFQAERIIGRGGTGVVYLARRVDGQFDQLAAVKVLHSNLAALAIHDGFLRERRILARLRHCTVAQLLGGGFQADGTPYVVTEYIEGERLDDYCRNRRLDVRARIALFRRVLDAVAVAHRSLIVHLDLKPSNILISSGGHPKLLDFGTAQFLTDADAGVPQVLATPRYASPEQLRGERAGIPSDIFSLGVMLTELLTGCWPFGNPESRISSMKRAVEHTAPAPMAHSVSAEHAGNCRTSLRLMRTMLRGDLQPIVRKALESDAQRRHQSVDELSADLGSPNPDLAHLAYSISAGPGQAQVSLASQ